MFASETGSCALINTYSFSVCMIKELLVMWEVHMKDSYTQVVKSITSMSGVFMHGEVKRTKKKNR